MGNVIHAEVRFPGKRKLTRASFERAADKLLMSHRESAIEEMITKVWLSDAVRFGAPLRNDRTEHPKGEA